MKILQLIPRLASGGAERFTADLSNELSHDNEVYIYTLLGKSEENIYAHFLKPKVKVGYLNMAGWTDPKIFFRLRKCLKEIQPDIIHVHGRAFHYLAPLKFWFRGIKIIQTIHNNGSSDVLKSFEISMFRYFYTTQKATPALISKEQRNNFTRLYPKAPYVEIPNGRSYPTKSEKFADASKEMENFKKDKETKVFLNIARLMPQKNHYLLINAFKKFKENTDVNAVLVIIGREVDANEECVKVKEFVKRECNDSVKWIGEKRNATDYLYLADYFCLSSLWEGMPITLLEAFATQCIPVCTKVGEISVMVQESVEGFLADEITEDAYVNALSKAYFATNEELSIIKENLKQKYVEQYSMKKCATDYLYNYQKIIAI